MEQPWSKAVHPVRKVAMARLKSDPITKADLDEYLENYSDFSFEVRILNTLIDLGFSCEHRGSYTDPATKKLREFDIRATKELNKRFLRPPNSTNPAATSTPAPMCGVSAPPSTNC